jgi:hypothetical protein
VRRAAVVLFRQAGGVRLALAGFALEFLDRLRRQVTGESLEVEIEHRRDVERQELRDDEPADDREAEGAGANRRRRPSRGRWAPPPARAAKVVIMIGRKRTRQASTMALSGEVSPCCLGGEAKSIIMMAFFFTMPMSMMMPT